MQRRVLSYFLSIAGLILIILGFLAVTFFRHHTGALIPHPYLFGALGLLLCWGGFLLQRYTVYRDDFAAGNKLRLLIEDIRAHGEQIHVDFSNCEIREQSDTREVSHSVILFHYKNVRTGETEEFISRTIPKDSVTLSMYLDKQKQTTLYVDKANRGHYFFDLDFLNA